MSSFLLLDLFGFFTQNIFLGISPFISKSNRHGVAWVRSEEGGVYSYRFTVDKPELLRRPNIFTLHSLFQQLIRLGLTPLFLEITTEDKVRVYKQGKVLPIFNQTK